MTVKITKPEINVREELNELKKPTGVAGEAMLRAETPQEQFNLIGAGRRNMIINGGFDVWQRGTSFTPAANYNYSADRARLSSNATVNITKESASLEGNVVNTIKLAIVSPTSGNNIRYDQRIEEFDYFKNKTFTLSFWVKASRTHALSSSYLYFGGGGVNTMTFALGNATTTWTKKTATFSVGDLSTATGTYADLVIGISSDGASIDIEYAQVQLELGKVATPFEHRSYGEELALCQRYYYKPTGGQIGIIANNTAYICVSYPFPVTMRGQPTVSGTSATMGWIRPFIAGGLTGQYSGPEAVGLNNCMVNYSSLSATGSAHELATITTSDVQFNAEL